jgi:hypothetical protein
VSCLVLGCSLKSRSIRNRYWKSLIGRARQLLGARKHCVGVLSSHGRMATIREVSISIISQHPQEEQHLLTIHDFLDGKTKRTRHYQCMGPIINGDYITSSLTSLSCMVLGRGARNNYSCGVNDNMGRYAARQTRSALRYIPNQIIL